MELSEKDLEKVVAGISKEEAVKRALENPELFREEQIERLHQEKEKLENLKQAVLDNDQPKKR